MVYRAQTLLEKHIVPKKHNFLNRNRDIDLVVRYGKDSDYQTRRYDALMGLVHGMNKVQDSNSVIPSFVDNIADYSQKDQMCVELSIDNRFTIHDKKTNTIIDLCFEGNEANKVE